MYILHDKLVLKKLSFILCTVFMQWMCQYVMINLNNLYSVVKSTHGCYPLPSLCFQCKHGMACPQVTQTRPLTLIKQDHPLPNWHGQLLGECPCLPEWLFDMRNIEIWYGQGRIVCCQRWPKEILLHGQLWVLCHLDRWIWKHAS